MCFMHCYVCCKYSIYSMFYIMECIVYIIQQGSPTFCGRWAKKWKNYKLFLLRAINSSFLAISSKFFCRPFFGPQNLKRATFGSRAIGWRPLLYSIHYTVYRYDSNMYNVLYCVQCTMCIYAFMFHNLVLMINPYLIMYINTFYLSQGNK